MARRRRPLRRRAPVRPLPERRPAAPTSRRRGGRWHDQNDVYTMLVAYSLFGDCNRELADVGVPGRQAGPVVDADHLRLQARLEHAAALFQARDDPRRSGRPARRDPDRGRGGAAAGRGKQRPRRPRLPRGKARRGAYSPGGRVRPVAPSTLRGTAPRARERLVRVALAIRLSRLLRREHRRDRLDLDREPQPRLQLRAQPDRGGAGAARRARRASSAPTSR